MSSTDAVSSLTFANNFMLRSGVELRYSTFARVDMIRLAMLGSTQAPQYLKKRADIVYLISLSKFPNDK